MTHSPQLSKSDHLCRHCLSTKVEAACRRPQSFVRKSHGDGSLRKPKQRVDDRSRFYARAMETACHVCRVRRGGGFHSLMKITSSAGIVSTALIPYVTSLHFSTTTSRSRNICLRVNIGSYRLRCIPMLKAIPISTAMSLNILREIVRVGALTRDCST